MENNDLKELKTKFKLNLFITSRRCPWCDPQKKEDQSVKKKILKETVSPKKTKTI